MKRIFLFVLLVSLAENTLSQQFMPKAEIVLPDSIHDVQTAWCDLDNDGLLDLLLTTTNTSNQKHFMFIKNDTVQPLRLHDNPRAVFTADAYAFLDYNRDNQMDIVVSGTDGDSAATVLYVNKGDFSFDEVVTALPPFSMIRFADLDHDARTEWILSGETEGKHYVHIFQETAPGTWEPACDSLSIQATSLDILDADGDGSHDLFLSGKFTPDSLYTGFLLNQGDFSFLPSFRRSWMGTAVLSDLNHDSHMDVTFTGVDEFGAPVSKIMQSSALGYRELADTLPKNAALFAADLNSDGVSDLSWLEKQFPGDTSNIIRYHARQYDTLPHRGLIMQRFGDLEQDGDLDLVQVIRDASLRIAVWENTCTEINKAPGAPLNAVAIPVFNRLFVYWDKPIDDHTPQESLTFDLFIHAGEQRQTGQFDLVHERRLTVSHGNNGTANFRMLKHIPEELIQFSIQAVDNALYAGGQCMGGGALGCVNITTESLSLCPQERVTLTAPVVASWFSVSAGYLGKGTQIDFQTAASDTVFYYIPPQHGCIAINAWTVSIKTDTISTERSPVYACANATIQLEAGPGWSQVQWTSREKGDLGSAPSVSYTVTQPDLVTVALSNTRETCTRLRETEIILSKPDLQVDAEGYKIVKGQSVTLGASGAELYLWSPGSSLHAADVANPAASPLATTTYTVTGYDSLGCEALAHVSVIVESTGFVPSLFTPNGDGNNDQLKVYGLSTADNFNFRIYTREGSEVFKTNDVQRATQQGWDGRMHGVEQPGGVYYWEVEGTIGTGNALLLNGKRSGYIVLLR